MNLPRHHEARVLQFREECQRRVARQFLATLDWTPAQMAAYQARVQGISDRLRKVRP